MKRIITRKTAVVLFTFLATAGLIFGVNASISTPRSLLVTAAKDGRIDTPEIFCASTTKGSINITVCAPNSGTSATGLPAGFSLQWMTCNDFAANGNQWVDADDPRLCKASFSGNANSSSYDLAPGECVTVNVGDFLFDNGASTNCAETLQCDTCYVFRAFGHASNNLNRSEFTSNLNCSTTDCSSQCEDDDTCEFCNCCVISARSWGNGGPCGSAFWQFPVTSLTLGTVTYTDLELCAILNTPANGNSLIALAQELIAAKLNQISINNQLQGFPVTFCSGYTCEEVAMIARCIADADAVIGGLVIPPHGNGFLDSNATGSLIACLHTFNGSELGVDGCPD
jgi:hypothetical protein